MRKLITLIILITTCLSCRQTNKNMNQEEYKQRFSEEDAVGWQAIDSLTDKLYPGQEPRHFAPILYYSLGGEDPLDGISVYQSNHQADHFHFITYGFSELYYNEESARSEYSKYGFELTFRLKKQTDQDNVTWACNLLQNLARYVFSSGKWFEPYHFIPANSPIRLDYDTSLTALVITTDPELGTIQTPNGQVQFLQLVGITTAEYETLKNNPDSAEELLQNLAKGNELLITDLDRK